MKYFLVLLSWISLMTPSLQAQSVAEVNSYDLGMQSATAYKDGHLQDAAFLFYAAQLRYRYEVARFPPDNAGDESEGVSALLYEIGAALNPAIFREPKQLQAAMQRYDAWTPVITAKFKPLWKSSHPAAAATAQAQMVSRKADFSLHMNGISTLLNDPEYFGHFRVQQDCNLLPADTRPPAAACEKARAAMGRMEEARKIEGLVWSPKQ